MANVKAFFKELSRTVAFVERGGDPRVLQTSLNLRLTGNPGTDQPKNFRGEGTEVRRVAFWWALLGNGGSFAGLGTA